MSKKTEHGFGYRLAIVRQRAGLSPEQLSVKSGVHAQTIRKLESGERKWPRLDIASKLAMALNVTLDELSALMVQ